MTTVKNPNTVGGKIHTEFHQLAEKYRVDVDTVAEIIDDFVDWMEKGGLEIKRHVD